ncbi:protein-tyrosine sulfotransferase 1-like [Diadema antillarum]|uniref:protein-tyrosine sulfotransferase 1-like n=1 Tax=Diadema antillarum TaxID=105358 RepID=UPI003A87C0F6
MYSPHLLRLISFTMARSTKVRTVVTVFVTATITYMLMQSNCVDKTESVRMVPVEPHVIYDDQNNEFTYHREMPLIFIGGMPRSGTTLMRAMLDAHGDVRCGEETRVIPRILSMRAQWIRSSKEHARLLEAGLTDNVVDDAISAFMLEIIAKHGEPAPRLCNKDPFVLKSMLYLHKVFPNGKYLLMIRDGRATVHSIISRKVTITGFDITNYRDCLKKWNQAVESMYDQCLRVGKGNCLPVFYEQLVLHPEEWMRKILDFLDLPWDDAVMHHEEHIGKPGGISLSRKEKSTDQVIKPVNLEALSKWVGHIPPDVVADMASLAPMLARLGYDPYARQPRYGEPDRFVLENEEKIANNVAGFNENLKKVYREKPIDHNVDTGDHANDAAKQDTQVFRKEGRDTDGGAPPVGKNDPRQYARERRNRRREGPYPVPA